MKPEAELLISDLHSPTEHAKNECGRWHFKEIELSIGYKVADSFDRFLDVVET